MMKKKNLLISKCLLGENVRFDGGHCKLDLSLVENLQKHFHLKALCPEVMSGMSIPRDPIEIRDGRIIDKSNTDLTSLFEPVKAIIKDMVESENITIALLKEDSPSCGVHSIYDGSFSGTKISGEGLITIYLRSLGVKVYSEYEVKNLIDHNPIG